MKNKSPQIHSKQQQQQQAGATAPGREEEGGGGQREGGGITVDICIHPAPTAPPVPVAPSTHTIIAGLVYLKGDIISYNSQVQSQKTLRELAVVPAWRRSGSEYTLNWTPEDQD